MAAWLGYAVIDMAWSEAQHWAGVSKTEDLSMIAIFCSMKSSTVLLVAELARQLT